MHTGGHIRAVHKTIFATHTLLGLYWSTNQSNRQSCEGNGHPPDNLLDELPSIRRTRAVGCSLTAPTQCKRKKPP